MTERLEITNDAWSAEIAVLRHHGGVPGGGRAHDAAAVRLTDALRRLGRQAAATFVDELGESVTTEAIDRAIFGREPEKSRAPHGASADDDNGGMVDDDDAEGTNLPEEAAYSWRKEGLLRGFEVGLPVERPVSFAWTVFTSRLIEEKRKWKRHADKVASVPKPGASDPDAAPEALPANVARTLSDASRFCAIGWTVMRQAASSTASQPPSPKQAAKLMTLWDELAKCIVRDVRLRARRLRWIAGVRPSLDNRTRAWQAYFYEQEGVVTHFDAVELRDDGATELRPAFQQHLTRFRVSYDSAAKLCQDMLDKTAGHPIRRTVDAAGKRRLPSEWEPARHPTLVSKFGVGDEA